MTAYAINYDLKKSGKDYKGLYEAIKSYGTYWHYLGSTWLIVTNETAKQVWDTLDPNVDEDDSMLIIEVRDNRAGWLPREAWEWITKHVPA